MHSFSTLFFTTFGLVWGRVHFRHIIGTMVFITAIHTLNDSNRTSVGVDRMVVASRRRLVGVGSEVDVEVSVSCAISAHQPGLETSAYCQWFSL